MSTSHIYGSLLIGCLLVAIVKSYPKGTWGKRFIFTIPQCTNESLPAIHIVPQVQSKVSVVLHTPQQHKTYVIRQSRKILLRCSNPTWNKLGPVNGGKLYSSRRIMAYMVFEHETCLLHPMDTLGYKYTISVLNSTDINSTSSKLSYQGSWFVVTPVYDKTILQIHSSHVPKFADIFREEIFSKRHTSQIILMKTDSFYVNVPMDLSGIQVYSDKAISVFAGAFLSRGGKPAMTMEHMLRPQNWGKQHVIPIVPGIRIFVNSIGNSEYELRVTTEEADFVLATSGKPKLTFVSSASQYILIRSSKPVFIVVHFFKIHFNKNESVSSMTVPSSALAIQRTTFSCRQKNVLHASIAVIASEKSIVSFNGLNLYLNMSITYIYSDEFNDSRKIYILENLAFSRFMNLSPVSTKGIIPSFTGYVSPGLNTSSWFYQMGMYLSEIHHACTKSSIRLNDGRDNDCDGYIDEELRNGIDDDNDDLVDEDTGILFWRVSKTARFKRLTRRSSTSAYVVSVIISIVISLLGVIGFIAFMMISDRMNQIQNINARNQVLPLAE